MKIHSLPSLAQAAILLAAVGLAPMVHAAPVVTDVSASLKTYFGDNAGANGTVTGDPVDARTEFTSRLTGVSTEDFEGFTVDAAPPSPLSFDGSGGTTINATLTGSDGFALIRDRAYGSGNGRFNTTPGVDPKKKNYLDLSNENSFTISFVGGISAFGFYGTDIGDFGGSLQLELFGAGLDPLQTFNIDPAGTPSGGLLFFGFIDTAVSYSSIKFTTIGNPTGDDFFGFDDMVVGDMRQIDNPPNPTPEPGSLALVGLSLLALTASRRRRG